MALAGDDGRSLGSYDHVTDESSAFMEATFNLNPEAILASAMEWIAENKLPGEVYDREALEEWARLNGWQPPQE